MKDTFFARINLNQRSESTNSFFDKSMKKNTSSSEFVEQYKVALQDRQEKEIHIDFNTWPKKLPLKSPSLFEKQCQQHILLNFLKSFKMKL